jgi:phage/plasmid-associated DNA primase
MPDFYLPHHEAKIRERGFDTDQLHLFWDSEWVRSVDNKQIHNGLLKPFPKAKGVKGEAQLLKFNSTSISLKLDNPPPDPKQDGRPAKYLYAWRDPLLHAKGYNTQPWFPPDGETRIITEGLFDALAATFLAGVNCAAATAPTHLKRSKLPPATTIYIGDADCPFHHFTGLLGGMLDGALATNVKLACLPRSPVGNYLYTDGKIPEDCKWGFEEWIRHWKAHDLDPKAEIQKIIVGALPPVQFLQRCIEEAGDIGIRWPDHTPQIATLAKAIVDATTDKAQRAALRDQLRTAVKSPATPLNDLIKARAASKKAKQRNDAEEERQRAAANGETPPDDPFAIWDAKPIAVHVSGIVREQADPLLRRVHSDSVLYQYDPEVGFWRHLDDFHVRRMVRPIVVSCYKASLTEDGSTIKEFRFGNDTDVTSSCHALAETADAGNPEEAKWFLTFANGTVDLRTMQLEPFSPEHGTTHHLAVDLQLTDECPAPLLRVITTCYGIDAIDRVRAFLRWCLDLSMPWEIIFYFLGGSRSGKGILLELAESLLPNEFTAALRDPSQLVGADQIQQFVQGKRLLTFPEVKPNAGRDRDWSMLLQLASHSKISARRMRASESTSAKHDIRCVLAGVDIPDLGKDSTQGLSQRARYMRTLPRRGEPDATLKDDLIGTTAEHNTIRGQVIGWALAMDREAAIAALNDQEFRHQRIELQAYTDPVSLFIDECLVPSDQVVTLGMRRLLLAAFKAWCEETNSTLAARSYTEQTLINQIRKVLPVTHRPRRSLTKQECEKRELDYGKRPKLPAVDFGYTVRPGLLKDHPTRWEQLKLDGAKRSEGGIQAILQTVDLPGDETLEQLWEQQKVDAETAQLIKEMFGGS